MRRASKIVLIIVLLVLLTLLAWAPWMDNQAIHDKVFKERALIDGTIDKQTGELICDYNVMWFPFGRYIASCEGGYFVAFWGKALYPAFTNSVLEIDKSIFTLGNDQLDKAVQDYLLSQKDFSWKTEESSRNFCVFEKLNPENNLFPFYLWVRCSEFSMQNNELKELSGISIPAKIDYPNELSFYDLEKFSHIVPKSGSLYSEDIKSIFPSSLQRRINNFDGAFLNDRIKNIAQNNFNK